MEPDAFFLTCAGCKTEKEARLYDSAQKDIKNEKLSSGLRNLELILIMSPEHPYAMKAALLGADSSFKTPENRTYFQKFAKFIVSHSSDENQQIDFQKRVADSYFESSEYAQAVIEYQRILSKPDFVDGRYEVLITLAKSYYFLRRFDQAMVEIKKVIQSAPTPELRFQGQLLVADIFSGNKQYKESLEIFSKIQNEDAEFYKKNNLALNVALIYEEMEDFDKAINVLKNMDRSQLGEKFINEKIERLLSRKEFLPGAGGLSR